MCVNHVTPLRPVPRTATLPPRKPPARAISAARHLADTPPRTPPPPPPPPLPPAMAPRQLTPPTTWARQMASVSTLSTVCKNARSGKSPPRSSVNSRLRGESGNPHSFSPQPGGVFGGGRGGGERWFSSSVAPKTAPVDSTGRTASESRCSTAL